MSAPRCLVIGAGRMAGGFVAPLLADAGWEVILASRDPAVTTAINTGGISVQIGTGAAARTLDGVRAIALDDPALPGIAAAADLFATAVGPNALIPIGATLAPLLRARLDARSTPVNIVTFENHRRAPELLIPALIDADASLAGEVGVRLGVGGAAVWRIIAQRTVTEAGVSYLANDEHECYVDGLSLVAAAPPHGDQSHDDQSCSTIPGITLVTSFDHRMVEKLWVFNAGHCAAAYLGWPAGATTLDAAMALPEVRTAVGAVVEEARQGLASLVQASRAGDLLPPRSVASILDRYVDPVLRDPVVRVAREPRRKLAPDDRLIGPAIACLAAGIQPVALANAIVAALTYAEPSDEQAADIQRELELIGPAELLSVVSGLHPSDELSKLICARYVAGNGRTGVEWAR